MATPELAIAKAALSASLFRADPVSISRPSVDSFIQQVTSTLAHCSRPNVQTCKDYILSNVAHSTGRSTSLAKYLVALCNSQVDSTQQPRPSTKRRRLHVLYIVNDVLHHVARQGIRELSNAWEPFLPLLIASAASFDKCPKHIKKLQDLIALWKEKQHIPDDLVPKLHDALAGSSASLTLEPSNPSHKLAKDAPFILPSFHGDQSTAWYDLPAATWLPHLVPNSTKPMLPNLVRPIQLAPGPADKALTAAVKALLSDAERLFSKDKGLDDDAHVDINELGERILLDEITRDVVGGDTYYGWSRRFCERMKDRRKGKRRGRSDSQSLGSSRSSRDRSTSRGRRRSSSSPSFKRRRMSHSRSRSRSRSYTPKSPSRSRSRSRRRNDSYSPSRSRSRNRSPQHPLPIPVANSNMPFNNIPAPPPPTGYNGPWPPPPPPPLGGLAQGWMPDPSFAAQMMGVWNGQVPPVPPPPPGPGPPQQGHYNYNNQYGHRGGYDGGYRGRGRGYHRGGARGYGRGR